MTHINVPSERMIKDVHFNRIIVHAVVGVAFRDCNDSVAIMIMTIYKRIIMTLLCILCVCRYAKRERINMRGGIVVVDGAV